MSAICIECAKKGVTRPADGVGEIGPLCNEHAEIRLREVVGGLRPVKLTRAEFVNLLSYFIDEDLQNRINDNLYEVRFAIDDDGLKFKINNYTWSAGTGKLEK